MREDWGDPPMNDPESLTRKVIEACADCDQCRTFMGDESCLFFRKLYLLYDKERERNEPITTKDMRLLVDLCNMCGLCPCADIRVGVREAKDAFVARDGMKPALRVLEDVRTVGKVCGAFPQISNLLLDNDAASALFKRIAEIHPERKLPRIPREAFAAWAKKRGLDRKREGAGKKIAYFAGCTAQYYFPAVAKAAVEVMERNGMNVYLPEQACCGMPSLLEGDRKFTFEQAAFNLQKLGAAIDDGYDIVCSCPTCGYMLKDVIKEGAFYSEEYRAMVRSLQTEFGGEVNKIPLDRLQNLANSAKAPPASGRGKPSFSLQSLGFGHARDQGYFAPFDVRQRIKVASHTYDLGEFLLILHRQGKLNLSLEPVAGRMVYYAPCHLKEQNIGQPWVDLLALVPEILFERVGGIYDCCGISGIMGLKRQFHHASLAMGSRLMEKIKDAAPERLVTDCLSCRIQFNQALPYKVFHPVEILCESYAMHRSAPPVHSV